MRSGREKCLSAQSAVLGVMLLCCSSDGKVKECEQWHAAIAHIWEFFDQRGEPTVAFQHIQCRDVFFLTKIRQGSFSPVILGHEFGHHIVFTCNNYLWCRPKFCKENVLVFTLFPITDFCLKSHELVVQSQFILTSDSVQSHLISFGSAECFCSAKVSKSACTCLSLLLCSSFMMKAMVMLFNALKNF